MHLVAHRIRTPAAAATKVAVKTTSLPAAMAPSASASANRSITVNVAPLAITTGSSLPATQPGVPYSVKLTAAGGIRPYTWSITQGTLTPALAGSQCL